MRTAATPHDHHHHVDPESGDRRVALAVLVNLGLTVAQVIGGVIRILMLGSPEGVDTAEVVAHVRAQKGVAGMHQAHF